MYLNFTNQARLPAIVTHKTTLTTSLQESYFVAPVTRCKFRREILQRFVIQRSDSLHAITHSSTLLVGNTKNNRARLPLGAAAAATAATERLHIPSRYSKQTKPHSEREPAVRDPAIPPQKTTQRTSPRSPRRKTNLQTSYTQSTTQLGRGAIFVGRS